MEPGERENIVNEFREKAKLLYEVSQAVASGSYLDEILTLIVGLTARVMGIKICSLMLLDEQKMELMIKATQSLSERYRLKPPVKVGESISGLAVAEKKPVSVLDVKKDKRYKFPEIAASEGLCSLISVPMKTKNRVMGVLNCYTSEPHVFNPEEIQTLLGVANQAALAIENARLVADKVAAEGALETRKKIDRAKRILMRRSAFTEEEAHRMMQKMSMDKRKSLKDIAEAIIVSEEIMGEN